MTSLSPTPSEPAAEGGGQQGAAEGGNSSSSSSIEVVELLQEDEVVRLKIAFLDRNRRRAGRWVTTSTLNPLREDVDTGQAFQWSASAWEELWAAYAALARPHTMEPPAPSARAPRNGVYVVEKV